jgi:plasmid stability protein
MEAEVRAILRAALTSAEAPARLGSRIHQRFSTIGGVELETPERTDGPREPDLA